MDMDTNWVFSSKWNRIYSIKNVFANNQNDAIVLVSKCIFVYKPIFNTLKVTN